MTKTAPNHDHMTKRSKALIGNHRRTRHGLRASSLPPGCSYLKGQLQALRRDVRAELIDRDGATSIYQEALIQSAMRHEQRALLAQRWLRKEFDSIEMSEKVMLLREIGKATDARDKCFKQLGIGSRGTSGSVSALYVDAIDIASDAPQGSDSPSDAPDSPDPTQPSDRPSEPVEHAREERNND